MQQNRGFEINHQIFSKTSQLVIVAEDEGFEPSVGFPTHAFQACALGRYANPPAFATISCKDRTLSVLQTMIHRRSPVRRYRFRTPLGPEGSKGRRALVGARGIPEILKSQNNSNSVHIPVGEG